MVIKKLKLILLIIILPLLLGFASNWNNPYPGKNGDSNTLYTSFTQRPKHLDPAKSYSSNEWDIIQQVLEPPLQYNYLKRPYELEPLVAESMPVIEYFDKNNNKIDKDNLGRQEFIDAVKYSLYTIKIKPNVYYQPHPAFVHDNLKLSNLEQAKIYSIKDFKKTDTRQLLADDFIYQIKRLADPRLNSPIFGLLSEYIVGLSQLNQELIKFTQDNTQANNKKFIDLNDFELSGVKKIDDLTYQIKIDGIYPQFIFWLSMPFFAPVPIEAEKLYSQVNLKKHNVTMDWFPVGTGPFMLTENNPNLQMILEKNPNFRGEKYPNIPENLQEHPRYLEFKALEGKPIPFLDKVLFVLEKESIPYWNKFLQGYYDRSGVSSESFDQALQATSDGLKLSDDLKNKGINLSTTTQPSTFYWGFNMLDDVVGGYSETNKKLRQAISIALDTEEYISIFMNGRGVAAMSILPPSIFGSESAANKLNSFVYDYKNGAPKRKSIKYAKQLLTEAGYKNGIDPKTKKPLVLYLDAAVAAGPDANSRFAWQRKQLKKLGIHLVIRATHYNRFQQKLLAGSAQLFFMGWNADYPDPENFLFLLYGKNSRAIYKGQNESNYQNAKFDELFEDMTNLPNGKERLEVINQMLKITQEDAPLIWGVHPGLYSLNHSWVGVIEPNVMSRNEIKYIKIDPKLRAEKRAKWNKPDLGPVLLGLLFFGILLIPAIISYWRKVMLPARNLNKKLMD